MTRNNSTLPVPPVLVQAEARDIERDCARTTLSRRYALSVLTKDNFELAYMARDEATFHRMLCDVAETAEQCHHLADLMDDAQARMEAVAHHGGAS